MASLFKMVECPYNPTHRIDPRKLSMHIIKCRRNNKHMRMETCPFNATHVVPTHKFKAHIVDCPDNDAVLRSIVNYEEDDNTSSDSSVSDSEEDAGTQTEGNGAPLMDEGVTGGQIHDIEEWGADQAGPIKQTGYDPKLASLMKPFVRMVPSGMGKSARNIWWRMEKMRVQQLQEGVPFSPDVRAALGIPDHLDTELPFALLAGSLPSTSGPTAASTISQLRPERSQQPMRRPRISNPACPPTYAAILQQQQQQQEQHHLQQERQLHQQQEQQLHEQILDQEQLAEEAKEDQALLAQQQHVVQDKQKRHLQENRGQDGDPMFVATQTSEGQQTKRLQPPAMVNRARLMQIVVSRPSTNVARPPPPISTTQEPLQQQPLEAQPRERQQQQQHVTPNPDQLRLQTELEEVMRNFKNLQSENAQLRDLVMQMSQSMKLINHGGSTSLSDQTIVETPDSYDQASVDRAAPDQMGGFEPNSGYQQQSEDMTAACDHFNAPNRRGAEEENYYNDARHYNGLEKKNLQDSCRQNVERNDYPCTELPFLDQSHGKYFSENICPQGELKSGLNSYCVNELGEDAPRGRPELMNNFNDGGESERLEEIVGEQMQDDLGLQRECGDIESEPSLDNENEVLNVTKCEVRKKPVRSKRADLDPFINSIADRIAQKILSRSVLNTVDSDHESSVGGSHRNLIRAGSANNIAHHTTKDRTNQSWGGSSKHLYQSSEGNLSVCGSQSSLVGSRVSLDSVSHSGRRVKAPTPSNQDRQSTAPASWADAARGASASLPSCLATVVGIREDSKSLQTAIKQYRMNASEAAPTKGDERRSGPSSSSLLRGVGRGILNPDWVASRNAKGRGGKGMASANLKM